MGVRHTDERTETRVSVTTIGLCYIRNETKIDKETKHIVVPRASVAVKRIFKVRLFRNMDTFTLQYLP